MTIIILFFPTIVMLASLPLWLIKKLDNTIIEYVVYIVCGIFLLLLYVGLEARTIEKILLLILICLLNAYQLKLYIKLLHSKRNESTISDAEIGIEYEGGELSEEDKFISFAKKLYAQSDLYIDDEIIDLDLSVSYEEFTKAIYDEYHVTITHSEYEDFTTLQDILDYINKEKYDGCGEY